MTVDLGRESSPPAVQARVPRGPRQIKHGPYRTRRQSRHAAVLKAVVRNPLTPKPAPTNPLAVNKWNYAVGKLVRLCSPTGVAMLLQQQSAKRAQLSNKQKRIIHL